MEQTIKNLIIFTVGMGVGAFGAIKIMEKRYEELYQEELASLREAMTRRKYPEKDENEMVDGRGGKVLVMEKDKYKKIARQYGNKENLTIIDGEEVEIDPAELQHPMDSDEDEYDRPVYFIEPNQEPHVISLEEFSEDEGNFDKLTLYFYEDDEVLVDDGEEIITDPEALIGEDALVSFGIRSENPEVVYVRNAKISTDYEIVRLSKSYQETVLGITPENMRAERRGDEYED